MRALVFKKATYRHPRYLRPEDRFFAKVERGSIKDCWTWTGHVQSNGYGQFSIDTKPLPAHRYAYELLVGPIPDGFHIDHLCNNRRCVNPTLLEAVTQGENNQRMWDRLPIPPTCPNGHPKDGRGDCGSCSTEAKRRWRQRQQGGGC